MSQSQSHNSIQSEASGSTKEPGADIPRSLHTGRCRTTGGSTSILTGSALSLYGPDPWIGGLGVKSEVWRFWSLVPSGLRLSTSGLRNKELRNSARFNCAPTAALQLASGDRNVGLEFLQDSGSCQFHWYTHTHTHNEKTYESNLTLDLTAW